MPELPVGRLAAWLTDGQTAQGRAGRAQSLGVAQQPQRRQAVQLGHETRHNLLVKILDGHGADVS